MTDGEVRDYRSVGEVLREARESKSWSVEQLSETTRIAPRIIAAIEHDDLGQVADPIYARGFIRNLALALGLDADWVLSKVDLRDATSAVPESVKRPAAAPPSVPPTAPATSERGPVWQVESVRVRKVEAGPRPPLPWAKIGLAVGVLAVLGVVLWWGPRWVPERAARVQPSPEAPQATWPVAADSVPPPADEALGSPDAGSVAMPPKPVPSGTGQLEAVGGTPAVRSLPSVIAPDPRLQRTMALLVRARSAVEVTVVTDGRSPQQRLLRAGETWALEARDHFEIRVTDPSAVEVDLDGVRRTPPPGWSPGGGWMLSPDVPQRNER
jgi:transcriptional regulator with XRE-family HTH domain